MLSILIIGAIFWAITLVVQNTQSVLIHFTNIPLVGILGFVFGILSLKIAQIGSKLRKKRLSKKKRDSMKRNASNTKHNNVFFMPPDFEEIYGKKKSQKKSKEA